jgi:hypothetical protein
MARRGLAWRSEMLPHMWVVLSGCSASCSGGCTGMGGGGRGGNDSAVCVHVRVCGLKGRGAFHEGLAREECGGS